MSRSLFQVTDKLWDYAGGVHPEPNKSISARLPIGETWLPKRLHIPVQQHIGQKGQLIVAEGDHVLKGQPLTQSTHGMAVPVHAPTSGTISRIGPAASAHPSGIAEITITLESDGKDLWVKHQPRESIEQLSNIQLLELIQNAGIVGLGGAGFPTLFKLTPTYPVKLLLINGAECEPYITADDTLMQAHAEEVIKGCAIMAKLLDHPTVVIAIESDKPKAIEAIQNVIGGYPNFHLKVIPTKYPSGGEKQLIQIITGEEVPSGKYPADLGIVVQNVGTAFAVKEAVYDDRPLIQRVVTLTGEKVNKPGNHWVLLGTPTNELLEHHKIQCDQLIVGGPMMGFMLPDLTAPVIKTTNCLIAPGKHELVQPDDAMPCIRCGSCAEACPAGLLPQQLHWYAQADDQEKLAEHNLFDCIECGACAFVCPSAIPLVLEYRQAKALIRNAKSEQLKAERAKDRFEARNARLENEKKAREAKHKQAAAARMATAKKAVSSGEKDDKSAMIAAALARAKAKKSEKIEKAEPKAQINNAAQPDNAAVIAQREARKAQARAAKESRHPPKSNSDGTDKAARVAAAIARAKAKREQTNQASTDYSEKDDKAAKVAAAIARAKAKRAQQENGSKDTKQPRVESDSETSANGPEMATKAEKNSDEAAKKAKIAAAIAKAKAKQMKANKEKMES